MVTKIIKTLLVLLAFAAIPVSAKANPESSNDPHQPGNGSTLLNQWQKPSKGHRAPSRNILELKYSDRTMSLYSESFDGEFSIRLENIKTGEAITIPIIVGDPVNIMLDCGEYDVYATNSEGLVFSGHLIISL